MGAHRAFDVSARVYAGGRIQGLVKHSGGEGWEPRITAFPQSQAIGDRWVDFRGTRSDAQRTRVFLIRSFSTWPAKSIACVVTR